MPVGTGGPAASSGESVDEASVFADLAAVDQRDSALIRRLLAWTLSADACCVDVGAHIGSVLEEILRVAPEGRHIAYEPLPHLAEGLRRDFPQVEVRCAAVSDQAGEAAFGHVRAAEAWSGLVYRPLPGDIEQDLQEIPVRLEVLDDAVPDAYAPSLIKIDVEGGEEAVLRGAERLLRQHQPTVIFEHGLGAANAYGTEPGDVFGLLAEARLRIFDLDGGGPYSQEEFERAYFASERVNWVAHR